MRPLFPATLLSSLCLLAACASPGVEKTVASAGDECGGSANIACAQGLTCQIRGQDGTTLGVCMRGAAVSGIEWFKRDLDERMTEEDVIRTFGQPARDIGSGIHIFVYPLDNETEVWIGMAGRVLYARHIDIDGSLIRTLTNGEVLSSLDNEPFSFELTEPRLLIRKRSRTAEQELTLLAETCGLDRENMQRLREGFNDQAHTLYTITDRDGSALYFLSVLPNAMRYEDRSDAETMTCAAAGTLLGFNERWMIYGLPNDGLRGLTIEQDLAATLTLR